MCEDDSAERVRTARDTTLDARLRAGRLALSQQSFPFATDLSSSSMHCAVHCLSYCSWAMFMDTVHMRFPNPVEPGKKKIDPRKLGELYVPEGTITIRDSDFYLYDPSWAAIMIKTGSMSSTQKRPRYL